MTDFLNNEMLMVWLINLLAETFPAQAILKGGMVLRLLNCPRFTNDLDYVFIPYSSKNEIAAPILEMLNKQAGLVIEHTMHSTCLRIIVSSAKARAQIELNVAPDCKTQELSTADLARTHHLQGRIVRVMSLDAALSHKLAAWMERGLMRDLYDVYYLQRILGISPDVPILSQRLSRLAYQRGKTPGPRTLTIQEFSRIALDYASTLTMENVRKGLEDLLDANELPGLELKIRAALVFIADLLEKTAVET